MLLCCHVATEITLIPVSVFYGRYLSRPCRFQSEFACCRLELVRRRGALFFERESLVLFQQSLALTAQSLVFVTKLHGSEVLLGRENKSAGEYQSTKQQQR